MARLQLFYGHRRSPVSMRMGYRCRAYPDPGQQAKMSEPIPFVWTWPSPDVASLDPTSVTVIRDPARRWFVTFHVDGPDPVPHPAAGQNVGIDLGVTDLAVLSTGEKISHPRGWERHERNLKRWQRRLARCQQGSENRAKRRVKVARAHARVADARRDFLHKLSMQIIRSNDVIAVEDLQVRNMIRNRSLARAISCTWGRPRESPSSRARRMSRSPRTRPLGRPRCRRRPPARAARRSHATCRAIWCR